MGMVGKGDVNEKKNAYDRSMYADRTSSVPLDRIETCSMKFLNAMRLIIFE